MIIYLLNKKIRRRLYEEVGRTELRVLIGAYLILKYEERWIAGYLAGRYTFVNVEAPRFLISTNPTSSEATCFCFTGAILRARDELGEWLDESHILARCFYLCEPHMPKDTVDWGGTAGVIKALSNFNDTCGYQAVIDLLITTIKENTTLRPWKWRTTEPETITY